LQQIEHSIGLEIYEALPSRLWCDVQMISDATQINKPLKVPILAAWGYIVETLWQLVTNTAQFQPMWDILSCRMLLWRSISGGQNSELGEWVRQQVVAFIQYK
jgi:hypothetical protein